MTMRVQNLTELFIYKLADVLDAEQQVIEALPKILQLTSSKRLKKLLESRVKQTEIQVERLQKISSTLNKSINGVHSSGMRGILEQNQTLLKENMSDLLRDITFITLAQEIEHYKLNSYDKLTEFAQVMKKEEVEKLLIKSLKNEKKTSDKLYQLAFQMSNESFQASIN